MATKTTQARKPRVAKTDSDLPVAEAEETDSTNGEVHEPAPSGSRENPKDGILDLSGIKDM
jgi:hypothetical protein